MANDLILNKFIDHTLLKPEATRAQIEKLCAEAKEYHFASVCVNLCWVKLAAELLAGSDVKVCCVIGFPLGATTTLAKMFEAEQAIDAGASEIDMVMNIGALKSGLMDYAKNDIAGVRNACNTGRKHHALLKVILETCLLTDDEKRLACKLSRDAGADFVKTSTGFSTGGATIADVKLMRETVGEEMGVKASGGVRSRADMLAMIEAGANRIGTSSGVAIMTDKMVESVKY